MTKNNKNIVYNEIKREKILVIDFGSQFSQLIARRVREAGVYCEMIPYDYDEDRLLTDYSDWGSNSNSNSNSSRGIDDCNSDSAVVSPSINSSVVKGVILSGGPESVHMEGCPKIPMCLLDGRFGNNNNNNEVKTGERSEELHLNNTVPILGICYGMQALAQQLGGSVETSDIREFGNSVINVNQEVSCSLLKDIKYDNIVDGINNNNNEDNKELHVWMSHGDKITQLPTYTSPFTVIASNSSCPYAIISNEERKVYGLQFHPEVTHTKQGVNILHNFIFTVCGCSASGGWTTDNIIDMRVRELHAQIGDDNVLLGLSGGVDSAVVAALLNKAVGRQLTCVFVDNGLLRLNEGDHVMKIIGDNMGVRVIRVNAQQQFLGALKGVTDPEIKRKTIGKVFIDVFACEAKKLSRKHNTTENGQQNSKESNSNNMDSSSIGCRFLAQGTIYPDVIESAKTGKKGAHLIKSHHNVGGLPDDLQFELVEPLRDLFKDEVRRLGESLGLPYDMVYRHPFPGPGLGVRVLGEVREEYCDILRQADNIFMQELYSSGWYHKTSQAFAVFLPIKSVGVCGDGRRYAYVISLRAVETVDFMTARFAQLPYDLVDRVSTRIMNEIKDVSRVVYDVSSKPPATIEWE